MSALAPRNTLLLLPLSLILATSITAAEPMLEKADLFESGKDGYALYRIPGIVVTAKGTVLAYCEARKSDKGDWGTIDILLRRSTDGGKTLASGRRSPTCRGRKRRTRSRSLRSSPTRPT